MFKRIFYFIIICIALFYAWSGFHFYKSTPVKSNDLNKVSVKSEENPSPYVVLKQKSFDFEDHVAEDKLLSATKHFSGKYSVKINPENEYGAEIKFPFAQIPSLKNVRRAELTIHYYNEKISEGTSWVFEVDAENGTTLSWNASLIPVIHGKWESATFTFDIDQTFLKAGNYIKTYAWNKNKASFFIDDVDIRMVGVMPENDNVVFNPLVKTTFYYDLESDSGLTDSKTISTDYSHSGKNSSLINGSNSYSVTITKRIADVMNDTVRGVWFSVWLYPLIDNPECTLTMEIRNSDDEPVYWKGKTTSTMSLKANEWQKVNSELKMPAEDYSKLGPDDKILIYVVNNKRGKIYVDDFTISYGQIPDSRGSQTYAMMNSDASYKFDRYHPPYQTAFLMKEDIGNNNSDYIINADVLKSGETTPGTHIFTGNFSGLSKSLDEVMTISGKKISVYHFCTSKMRFVLSGESILEHELNGSENICCGDFNGDGKQDILISTHQGTSLYENNFSAGKLCADNTAASELKKLWHGELDAKAKIIAGKFSGDNKDEVVILNADGNYSVNKFSDNEWKMMSNGILPTGKKSTQVAGKFINARHDQLLNVVEEKNETHVSLWEYDGSKLVEKKIPESKQMSDVFDAEYKMFRMKNNSHSDDIFVYKHDWRFECKIISTDSKGFFVSSVPEFKGYQADQNPKYYEYIQLLPGKFSANERQVMCFVCNCTDENFDGIHCRTKANLTDLPNSVQLYSFPK